MRTVPYIMEVAETCAGFTLVEIMIVVSIIGLLCAIAIPSFNKARHTSLRNAFINDLRIASDAFMTYNMDHRGMWPTNRPAGTMPPEMTDYLTRFPWTQKTQVGGSWDWDYSTALLTSMGLKAAVGVLGTSWSEDDMRDIDSSIDDGNLTSGTFRQIGTKYMSILE
jgi:prepilin-type N-terminal cleavage/methylation domain-containing protein